MRGGAAGFAPLDLETDIAAEDSGHDFTFEWTETDGVEGQYVLSLIHI